MSRALDAYRDEELSSGRRSRIERELATTPGLARELRYRNALGKLAREAWAEGPTAPAPEYLIAALRPDLARIDAELARGSWWRRSRSRLSRWFAPGPVAALAGGTALVLLLIVGPGTEPALRPTGASTRIAELAPALEPAAAASEASAESAAARAYEDFGFGMPTAVYDFAQGESPIVLFEAADGSTVIWLMEEGDSVSYQTAGAEGWA